MGIKTMTGNTDTAGPYRSRWEERDARRRANAELARQAGIARAAKNKSTRSVKGEVEAAAKKLEGSNVVRAVDLIKSQTDRDRDYFIIAEKYGQARVGVLKHVGAPRGTVERQYLDEVGGAGLGSPEQTEE